MVHRYTDTQVTSTNFDAMVRLTTSTVSIFFGLILVNYFVNAQFAAHPSNDHDRLIAPAGPKPRGGGLWGIVTVWNLDAACSGIWFSRPNYPARTDQNLPYVNILSSTMFERLILRCFSKYNPLSMVSNQRCGAEMFLCLPSQNVSWEFELATQRLLYGCIECESVDDVDGCFFDGAI